MKVLILLLSIFFVLLILNGHNVRSGNERLDRRCNTHGGSYQGHWDGAKLIAVTCNDGKGFKR